MQAERPGTHTHAFVRRSCLKEVLCIRPDLKGSCVAHRGALRRRADDRGCAARSMPERLASLPATLPVHVREIRSRVCRCGLCSSCACRLDLANIHRHTHHSSRRWWCRAAWSDMKRTCATCHEYSWHAPFVSSNSMVVVTNGGHSRSGRHSSPRAPFCTVLGAPWS